MNELAVVGDLLDGDVVGQRLHDLQSATGLRVRVRLPDDVGQLSGAAVVYMEPHLPPLTLEPA